MHPASIKAAHAAMNAGAVLKTTELRKRGWTSSMIARLLPEPDMTLPNPEYRSGAPMRLYLTERVESIEATLEFAQRRDAGARRSELSKASAAKRADELVQRARAYVPALPSQMEYSRLASRAARSYDAAHRPQRHFADDTSTPEFHTRVTWNHFRHHLTDWDITWEGFSGKPGVRDAYIAAAESLTTHVSDRFPELRDAAHAWLARKRSRLVIP